MNFQPRTCNELSEKDAKNYIGDFFFIMTDDTYRIKIDCKYEEITREKIEKTYFRTLRNKDLSKWFFDEYDILTYPSDIVEKPKKEEQKKTKKEEKKPKKKEEKKTKKEETSDEDDPLDANIEKNREEIKKSIDEALDNFD